MNRQPEDVEPGSFQDADPNAVSAVAHLRRLVNGSLDAAITMDLDGSVRHWNSAASELFGWSDEDAVGKPLAELVVPPTDRNRFAELLQRHANSELADVTTRRLQTRVLDRDGHEFPVEIAIIPAPLGNRRFFTAFIRDMREPSAEAEDRGRLAAIVDSSTDAIIGRTLQGVITSWNASAERVYGYSAQEAIGQPISMLIPDEVSEEEPELREVLTAGNVLQSFEVVRRRKDGRLIDVSISISPIRNSQGEFVGSATIERDITAERASRQALEEREEQIRLLLESTAEAIYGVDLDGICTFCNPSCVRMLGYDSPRQLIGQHMHRLIHHHWADGSDYPIAECQIYRAIQDNHGTHVLDEVFWRADGSSFPVEYWSFPMRRGERVCGAVVTFLDVSERLNAERDRLRLAAIVESTSDPIIGLDLNGSIESWNKPAERVFGWTAAEATGQPVELLLAPGREEAVHDAVVEGRRINQREVRCVRMDGQEFVAALTLSPIRDAHDRHVGASIIARDISRRKQREWDLKEATTEAQAANHAKSNFLANISHELRTPMNAIIGMLELALTEDLTEAMQDYLGTARDASQTLLYLLNDLLDFSRIESGKFRLDPQPFSLRETLDHTARTLALRASEKGLELTCRIASNVPDVLHGDGLRLRQVVTNLVGNAIKFTDEGDVSVECRLMTDEAAAHSAAEERTVVLHVTVSDTGVGISPEDQEQIFASFAQADTSSTRRYQGSGLGLTICRELVERMGGRIWVDSELEVGSRFHFTATFPVVGESQPDEEELRLRVAKLRDTPVLVVDDNASNRRILEESLKQWRMLPTVVDRAHSALEELRQASESGTPYPVVLVDALMPDMDGFTLMETAQAEGLLCDSEVLMLSSADRQTFRERCEEIGITRYLEKPVSQSHLLDSVTRILLGAGLETEQRTRVLKAPQPLKLLVAEDTRANQKVVRAILEKRGHEVVIADNGQAALEQLQASHFDVVLMDVQMPVLDGYRATEAIRQLPNAELAATPIIATTAHALREDMDRCLRAGMNAYISKPLDAEKLIRLTEQTAARGVSVQLAEPAAQEWEAIDSRDGRERRDAGGNNKAEIRKPEAYAIEPALLDRELALTRLGGDTALLADLMQCFIEDAPLLLTELDEALRDKRTSDVARAAHSLKGLAANFEAIACRDAALAVEQIGRNGNLEEGPDAVSQLRSHVEQLIVALQMK